MTITLELAPEQEDLLREQAQAHGQSPADFLLSCAGLLPPSSFVEKLAEVQRKWAGKTLAEALAGQIGTVDSAEHNGGVPSHLSEKTGESFTEYLLEKKRQGRL